MKTVGCFSARLRAALLFTGIALVGCSAGDPNTNVGMPTGEPRPEEPLPTDDSEPIPISEPDGVEVADGTATISARNSRIAFTGRQADHVEHTGGFREFSGSIRVSEAGNLEHISVEIQTESLQADNQGLTVALKGPDFFAVKEHPTAIFESTRIEPTDTPQVHTITGNLTLLGTTQEVTFDSSVILTGNRLRMVSRAFVLDKSRFGMDYAKDGLLHEVDMKIMVGIRHGTFGGGGGGGGGGSRGPRGNFDPEEFFASRDQDGDGSLRGDEIPQRMRQNLAAIDADADGGITLQEMRARRRARG